MAKVNFTYALKRFFPTLEPCEINASNARELVESLEQRYPGLKNYILEDHGALRKHVNIFINNELIKDRDELTDDIGENDEVFVMQALSGG